MFASLPTDDRGWRGSTLRPPSPARAANLGIEMAEGDLVGLSSTGRAWHRLACWRRPAVPPPRSNARSSRPWAVTSAHASHGRVRHGLRPGRGGRLLARDRLGARRLPAVLDQHARGVVGVGMVSARWARATRCSCRAMWEELRASTSASRCRAAGSSTTICIGERARSKAPSWSCCSARGRSTRSTAARRRPDVSLRGDAR